MNARLQQYHTCCIFRPAFGCCTPQTLVEIVIFSIFCAKNLKKCKKRNKFGEKFGKKTGFFQFAPKLWLSVLFPDLFDQRFGSNLKKPFFAKFCSKFVTFSIFACLHKKRLKIKISTMRTPNTGQNIQHLLLPFFLALLHLASMTK